MCTSDVTPLLLYSNSNEEDGYTLDFGTKHKCRNYDKIASWEEQNLAVALEVSFNHLFGL